MNEKDWAELLKYSNPYSILVVTYKNELIELSCPFAVIIKENVGNLIKGDKASVSQVKVSTNLITVYIINGDAFYFFHFILII